MKNGHIFLITIQNLKIGGSGSGKTNTLLLNLINEQKDIDKIYLYAKYLSESKY